MCLHLSSLNSGLYFGKFKVSFLLASFPCRKCRFAISLSRVQSVFAWQRRRCVFHPAVCFDFKRFVTSDYIVNKPPNNDKCVFLFIEFVGWSAWIFKAIVLTSLKSFVTEYVKFLVYSGLPTMNVYYYLYCYRFVSTSSSLQFYR